MKQQHWAIAATFSFMLMTFVASVWVGTYGPIWRSAWLAQRADWLGFFGNAIAGAVTLAAAIVAWFAVQRQILANKLLAARNETALLDLASSELAPFARTFMRWSGEARRRRGQGKVPSG